MKRIVKIETMTKDNKRELTIYNFFSRCRYIEGSGSIDVQIHPDLKTYFLELKSNFTQFKIDTLMRIPSTYSYRLYELLKQYHQMYFDKSFNKAQKHNPKISHLSIKNYREFEIADLQEKLNINGEHAPSYRSWGRFTEKVLQPAQKHFKQHTDLIFTYEGYKEYGRKFTHVRFTFSKNPGYQQMSLPLDNKPKGKIKTKKTILNAPIEEQKQELKNLYGGKK
jgi:plasmid replication initiation protein